MKKAVGLLFFLASICAAQTPLPVTGNLSQILGSPAPYATVKFQLQNCPAPVQITGSAVVVQTELDVQADAGGSVNTTIWPTNLIDCNGTTGNAQYAVTYIVGGVPAASPSCYAPTSSLTNWNLAVLQPVTCNQTPPNPQDVTYNNIVANQNISAASFTSLTGFNWIGRFAQNYTNSSIEWLKFTDPLFNQSVTDSTAVSQFNGATPADPYATPIFRVVSSDSGVNDTAPAFLLHNCNYTGGSTSAPCVGLFAVSQNNSGDSHSGVWGANFLAIQYRSSLNNLTYGIENNVFNMTGVDPGSPDNPTSGTSPVFGYASTIGGNAPGSNGTAAYFVTDENAGSYWWDGLYVQRAKYAAVEAGPVAGGSGLQYSFVSNPNGQAQPGANYGSVPQQDLVNDWNGTGSYLESLFRQFIPRSGINPVNCYSYTFSTNLRHELCDDGELVVHSGNGVAGVRVTPDNDADSNGAFQVTNHANNTNRMFIDKLGNEFLGGWFQLNSYFEYGTTPFTVAGCSASAPVGSGTAGVFQVGATNCTAVITINGATGMTALHAWTCDAHDRTHPTVVVGGESASTNVTASITIPSTVTVNDIISFSCQAY